MRAMILAAGRGERMGALTAATPKPLLRVAGHYLIEYAITNLVRAGVTDIVINIAYHAAQIKTAIGDGKRYGVNIIYSEEAERLEVAGGIAKALPLLGNKPFIVMSSDIITDYALQQLPKEPDDLAHLILVDNPDFHLAGDFGLQDKRIDLNTQPTLTFGSIGLYRPELFADCAPTYQTWFKWMRPFIQAGRVTGEHYQGYWQNIGTPEELALAQQRAREDSNLRPLASETNTLSN